MAYLKPQSPLYHKKEDTYFYPLTTADQVITGNGERLNSLFKKTIKETVVLRTTDWSETKPYTQTITLTESTDDYNVDANVAYGDGDNAALHAAAGCISYIKKNHKEITFYCLKSKPEVDIPIEITGTCRNTIATVEEGIKLNFDIIGNPRPKTGDTLYWDGNTEGLEVFSSQWYKVSSIAPSIEDFSNGYTILLPNGVEVTEKNDLPAGEVQANVISIGSSLCIVVTKDNVEAGEGVFLSKGIYFLKTGNMYVSSLTIPGFTGFEKDDIEVKENTIWVDTDVPITGYKFSATEPEDMVEGEVWIRTGDDSSVAFDIVEGAEIYPLSVKQYVSGSWVDKTAMSYQNGAWTQWLAGYYYKAGVGSTVGAWQAKYQTGNTQNSIEFNEDGIKYNFNNANYSALIAFSPIQDLTNVSKLVFRLRGNNTWFMVGAASVVFDGGSNHFVAQSEVDYFTGEQEVSVDVSSLSGNYYIAAYGFPESVPSEAYCYDVQGVE